MSINLKPILVLIACLIFLSPVHSAPPVDANADDIISFYVTPNVPIDDYLGVKFYVHNDVGVGIPNHHCTISVYKWIDNTTSPLREYRFREVCIDNDGRFLIDSGLEFVDECYLTTMPSGEFYFITKLTRDKGYDVSPQTGSYVGGYGTYKLEAHCGNTTDLVESANFTVVTSKEPTYIMDYARFIIDNPAYVAFILLAIMFIASFIYWVLVLVGVK